MATTRMRREVSADDLVSPMGALMGMGRVESQDQLAEFLRAIPSNGSFGQLSALADIPSLNNLSALENLGGGNGGLPRVPSLELMKMFYGQGQGSKPDNDASDSNLALRDQQAALYGQGQPLSPAVPNLFGFQGFTQAGLQGRTIEMDPAALAALAQAHQAHGGPVILDHGNTVATAAAAAAAAAAAGQGLKTGPVGMAPSAPALAKAAAAAAMAQLPTGNGNGNINANAASNGGGGKGAAGPARGRSTTVRGPNSAAPALTDRGTSNGGSRSGKSSSPDPNFLMDDEAKEKADIRRARRMLSNRESARRSRRRKQEHMATLEGQVAALQADRDALARDLQVARQQVEDLQRENERLRAGGGGAAAGPHGYYPEPHLGALAGTKMERSASMQRVASLEHLGKKARPGSQANLESLAEAQEQPYMQGGGRRTRH